MMFCFAATIKPIFLHWVETDRTPEIAPNRRNLLYDVDRTCSEPDDRIKHVLDTDPRPAGIPLPPSSHAKAVNAFGSAKILELELRRVLRGEIRFDAGACASYASDRSSYRQAPIGMVIPRDNDDVIAAMTACRKFGAPVLSRGAGTSLAGQCCNVAVVFDYTKYMNRILEMNKPVKLGFLFSPTEFETHAEVSFVEAVASTIANRQGFHEAAAIDVLACVRNRVVRRIRDVERFDTEL